MAILKALMNNIPLTLTGVWLIIFPCMVIYKKIQSKIERFPTTIRYDRGFQRFKDGLKQSNSSKKGF